MNAQVLGSLLIIGAGGVVFAIFDHRREQARRRRNPAVPSEIEWTVGDFRRSLFVTLLLNVVGAALWLYFRTLPAWWVTWWPATILCLAAVAIPTPLLMPLRALPLFEARVLPNVLLPQALSMVVWFGIWNWTLSQSPHWKFAG